MGALVLNASSTVFIICAKVVSEPTLVALIFKTPVLLIVAPIIVLPLNFSTGILSPVMAFSSTPE